MSNRRKKLIAQLEKSYRQENYSDGKSNDFYENLEDGFYEPTADPLASEFNFCADSSSLRELHRDYARAKSWAKNAVDRENREAWAKIRDLAKEKYEKAYRERDEEREEIEKFEKARFESSLYR